MFTQKLFLNFPRNCEFYEPLILSIGKLSTNIIDQSVQLILELLPDITKPEFFALSESQKLGGILDLNFTSFTQTIVNYDNKYDRITEILVSFNQIERIFNSTNIVISRNVL